MVGRGVVVAREWHSHHLEGRRRIAYTNEAKMPGNFNAGEQTNDIRPYGQLIVLGHSEYLVSESSWTPKGKPNKTLVLKPRVRVLDGFKIGYSADHHNTVPTTRQARFILNGKNR